MLARHYVGTGKMTLEVDVVEVFAENSEIDTGSAYSSSYNPTDRTPHTALLPVLLGGDEDANLAASIFNGNHQAEDQLVRKYRTGLFSMLYKLSKDREKAEDVTHDTLAMAIQKLRDNGIDQPHRE